MIILICGGRDFNDWAMFNQAMSVMPWKPTLVVHGDARGADTMGKLWALKNGIYAIAVPALWDSLGNKAGSARNQKMLDLFNIDQVIAFPGGSGTQDMINRANDKGIPVWRPYP